MKPLASETARRAVKWTVAGVLMPAVVVLGAVVFREKYAAWLTLTMVLLAQVLFFAGFEKRTVGSRRLVIAAVMTALSVLGRFVFAAIPGFKPITAMVVITAIWLGGETGFLVGALTAVISNFFFGQGPWTPFQMFAFGMIGLAAGLMAKPLQRSRVLLALYGVLAGVAYSLVMDVWSVLWYSGGLNWGLYAAALVTALPHTAAYALSNAVFLLLLGRPFGEKLGRVKLKYGI